MLPAYNTEAIWSDYITTRCHQTVVEYIKMSTEPDRMPKCFAFKPFSFSKSTDTPNDHTAMSEVPITPE